MAASDVRIGVLRGRENSFPDAFIAKVNSLGKGVSALDLADRDERRHEPPRANGGSLAGDRLVLAWASPQGDASNRQLVFDREHSPPDALVRTGQEADERDDEQRGVELVRAVVLLEGPKRRDSAVEYVEPDLVRRRPPLHRLLWTPAQLGECRAAVGGDPAHHLRGRIVARLLPERPESAVRLPPATEDFLDLPTSHRPDGRREPPPGQRGDSGRVDQAGKHIVL